MSHDEKMVTEEEARRREREAFEQGACWLKVEMLKKRPTAGWLCPPEFENEAKLRYPIKRKVPRVGVDPCSASARWRWNGDRLEVSDPHSGFRDWHHPTGYLKTASRVRLWADLLANPYEEVDE